MSIAELEQIIRDFLKKPAKTIGLVIIFIVIVIGGFWANGYFSKKGEQAAQTEKKYENPKSNGSLPSADEITALGRRALWSNEYWGSREAYSQLLDWKNSIKDPKTSKLLSAEIKRVEDDYRSDIMRSHIDRGQVIWVPHVDGKYGFVKSEGFEAGNVLAHLSPNRRVDERARAACILRNIKTSPDKDSVNKEDLYEALIRHMDDQEPSLTVSKMAFETYKDLTGFSSDGVFDFAGAIKDWEKRKDEILKINFQGIELSPSSGATRRALHGEAHIKLQKKSPDGYMV